ncbi:MAG TPA: ABC transporter ATP-binding protein [Planctomicrobium sp.]|nr:ABC transporter ATP-binding protein [Planctomicrobium sp.]
MSNVVSLQHVSKRFRKTQALDDVSIEIPPGTVCALLGANGAGKSTAIRCLLGLERPDSGRCEILGMESQKYSREIRQRVGYVAEKPALYDWMTVEEMGWFAAGFYPPGYQQEYQQNVSRFGLSLKQRISELSKGSRAKVALSLALSHNPRLLVLDEPTSGLDPLVRREFLQSMVDVAGQGRTVLLCSHQVHEVERVADYVAILLQGKLACFERLDDLKHRTRELVMRLPESDSPLPPLPGVVLAQTSLGQERSVLIRDLDEQQLSGFVESGIAYEVRHPNLEEILLSLLREKREQGERDKQDGKSILTSNR